MAECYDGTLPLSIPDGLAFSALSLTPENATDAPTTSIAPELPLLERLDVYYVALQLAAMVPGLTQGARASLRDRVHSFPMA